MSQQRLAPDAILASSSLSGAVTAIQDDPDSPDASWLTAPGSNNNTEVRVSFPTPTSAPVTGAGLQNFRVLVRKTNHSTNPTCTVELYEGGTLRATLLSGQSVSSTTGVVLEGTWNASSLGTPDGSAVECRVTGVVGGGNPGNRASLEVGAVEWNAEVATPVAHSISIAGESRKPVSQSGSPLLETLAAPPTEGTVSFSYGAAGKDNRSLAVDIPDNPNQVAYVIWANEGTAVSDVTIGGVSCSLIATGDWNGVTGLVKVSRLIDPPTGAQTLSLPGSGAVESLIYALVVAQGAHQTTPEGAIVIDDYVDEGFSTTTDVDIAATNAGALIIGAAVQGESDIDPDPVAPLVARAEAIGSQAPYGRSISAATRQSAASGTLTLEWTHALNDLSAVAIEVLPAPAGTEVTRALALGAEAGQSILQGPQLSVAWTAAALESLGPSAESLGRTLGSDDAHAEALSGALRAVEVPAEALALARRVRTAAVESAAAAVVRQLAAAAEWMSVTAGSRGAEVEALSSSLAAYGIPGEATGHIGRSPPLPLAWANAARRSLAASVEAVAALLASGCAELEAQLGLARASDVAVETPGAIRNTIAHPFESLGTTIAVTHAVEAALEWLSAAVGTRSAPAESLMQARAEGQPSVEAHQQARRALLAALATEQRARTTSATPTEALGGLRQAGVLTFEAVGQALAVTRAVEFAIESFGRVVGDQDMGLELVEGFRAESNVVAEALAHASRQSAIPAAALASLVRAASVRAETTSDVSIARTVAAEALGRALHELATLLEADGTFPVPPLLARLVIAAAAVARTLAADAPVRAMAAEATATRALASKPSPSTTIGG